MMMMMSPFITVWISHTLLLVANAHLSALRSSKLARILTWRPRRQLFEEIVVKYAPAKWQAQTKEAERYRASRPPLPEKKSEADLDLAKQISAPAADSLSAASSSPETKNKNEGEDAEMKPDFIVQSLMRRQKTERMLKVDDVCRPFL